MAFVHLHVHSQFSLLDGTASPDAIAAAVADRGMSAVALTDSANLYGAVAFYKACKAKGVKGILGAEVHLLPEGLGRRTAASETSAYQILLLVRDQVGYQNLCRLLTTAIFDGMHYRPNIDLDLLRHHQAGLIVLSGGRKGVVGRPLMQGKADLARERLLSLAAAVCPGDLYLELQDHGLVGEDVVLEGTRRLSKELGVPTVITNAVHYLNADDAPVHELLHAIALGSSLADEALYATPTDQAWLKTEAEMRALFPDDGDAIDRTAEVAARCNYSFKFGEYHFPATTPPDVVADADSGGSSTEPDTDANWAYFYRAFPPPRDFGLPDPTVALPPRPPGAGNLAGYFGWYAREGLQRRLLRIPESEHASYEERLELELRIIAKMGFPAYLLIVAEFINWSKDNGIPVGPGRGSAAGSLVAWAMRITDIDPIRFGLLFERFLNPERVSMPDIDVDFCQDRREEAIEHVRQKYGTELVSQIITYGTLKAKAAVRDVCRVLDMSFSDADRIAKLIPEDLSMTLEKALEQVEPLRAMMAGDPKVRRVLSLARRIEGLCRQTGVHAAGVVIADRPLVEYAPLYRDGPDGGPVVQYDMKSAETIGLIKFDFLGLKTLDQIRDALVLIERNHGIRIDAAELPLDDAETYTLLSRGDALGIFQLESSGMRDLLSRLQPSCVDDMVALVALYRPGPLQSGMTDDFVERKHGRTRVEYALPMLEPVLSGTYGTIIYQEQVMQIAQVMAGYSLGEADLLRRAMGKKNPKEMAAQKERFVTGSVANGIAQQKAEDIFAQLATFAEYGFNKSHSAAYGYVSYQTAWLKAHYRPEYMAALMTVDADNTDKVLAYIRDCQQAGIRVDSVCLNHSVAAFDVPPPGARPDGDVVRFGLRAVKNVGAAAVEAVLEARNRAGGKFEDAFSFFEHIDPKRVNRRVVEQFIKAGAFHFSGLKRRALWEGLDAALAAGARKQADTAAGQGSLFGALPKSVSAPRFRFPDVPEWPLSELLQYEREVLGLYLTGHPMDVHGHDVERFASRAIRDLEELRPDSEVRLVGLPADVRTVKTKNGDRMAFVQLEDTDAAIECTFFSQAWARSQRTVESGVPILVTGTLENRDGELKLRANAAELLSEVRVRNTREVTFVLRADELVEHRLQRFIELLRESHGPCPARVVIDVPGRFRARLGLPRMSVDPGAALEERVLALFGRADAVVLS
jgi:DNA polymerase-3 subunit alpha